MRNSDNGFGWLTRLIHWLMALGILFMLGLGTWIRFMEVRLDNLWLFALHKSIGVTLLALLILRIVWHRMSPPPAPLVANTPGWQIAAAYWTHRALYVLMLLVPVTGWIASGATGLPVQVWGLTLPGFAPVSEVWEQSFFVAHGILTKLLLLAVVLHVAGALNRHVVKHDRTLLRMIRG